MVRALVDRAGAGCPVPGAGAVQFRNFLIVSNVIMVVGSVCAAALPYRRRELFEASPKILRARLAGVPAITIVAGLSALAFLGVVIDVASRTAYSGGYSADVLILRSKSAAHDRFNAHN